MINIGSSGNELPDLDRLTMVPPTHKPNFDFGHNGPMTEDGENEERRRVSIRCVSPRCSKLGIKKSTS